jgi:hypothetical protein
MHNIVVGIVYKDTDELYKVLENVKSMSNVTGVEWSELVQEIEYSDAIKALVRKKNYSVYPSSHVKTN